MSAEDGFESYSLDPRILSSLSRLNFTKPTPIQAATLPPILEGRDLIALAETGSGKTAACAIPLCHCVNTGSQAIQALIVVPTRELALQYSTATHTMGRDKQVQVFALLGGEDFDIQRAKLKHGVQILVATPGRLIDFIFARAIDLSHVSTLVLDEADQMLSLGFIDDLEFIMQCLVHPHQTLFFSATMPLPVRKIAQKYMKNPVEISLIENKASPETITHQFYFCSSKKEKIETLLKIVTPASGRGQVLLFANARHEVESITRTIAPSLAKERMQIDFLHGGLPQNMRTLITNKFQKKRIDLLVTTDVASRGLDFAHVTHVINFSWPRDLEGYLHRAGRTGRQGRLGTCITLMTSPDLPMLKKLTPSLPHPPQWIVPPPSSPKK